MTVQMLIDCDPEDEVRSWLETICRLADGGKLEAGL
jgi:hypothetical protein